MQYKFQKEKREFESGMDGLGDFQPIPPEVTRMGDMSPIDRLYHTILDSVRLAKNLFGNDYLTSDEMQSIIQSLESCIITFERVK